MRNVATASAPIIQVIQWTNKSRYRSHREGVVLEWTKYTSYLRISLFERKDDWDVDYLK